SDHPELLDALKQAAFYTDAYGACRWSLPEEAIPGEFARSIVSLARRLSQAGEAMTSAEELELWVKHVGPVWKKEMWEMSQALAACYAEAEERGLLRGGPAAREMTRVLFGLSPSANSVEPSRPADLTFQRECLLELGPDQRPGLRVPPSAEHHADEERDPQPRVLPVGVGHAANLERGSISRQV